MTHGLVIGKFYPPHAGHHHLVRTAAARCDRLTVVVMASSVESLSLDLRVAWMREVHADDRNVTVTGIMDDHPVDLASDVIWRAHVDLMRQAIDHAPVDVVFTSERYGDELGRLLGARHQLIDLDRRAHPISATAIRADPLAHWWQLAPCVRAHLALRVVLVGAESTGKTTLAADLATAVAARGGPWSATRWVPEVGREVTEHKLAALGPGFPVDAITWPPSEFLSIARAQSAREDALARLTGPVLLCDTDAFATSIWHERYLGEPSPPLDALAAAAAATARARLYLLTHPADVPFIDDGLRDGEHIRDWMTARFASRLAAGRHRWHWLRGPRPARLPAALSLLDAALPSALSLAPPLG